MEVQAKKKTNLVYYAWIYLLSVLSIINVILQLLWITQLSSTVEDILAGQVMCGSRHEP